MKNLRFCILFLMWFSIAGCANAQNKAVSIVNWNVQTFFDAETDGTEYDDFKSAGKWSKDKYLLRLQRLCNVMVSLNADIYVFEEIECQSVIYDISNQLAGNTWSNKAKWHFAGFAKDEDGAIGCAIISRYPLKNLRTHSLDIRTQTETQPSVRPLVGKKALILANHWKSKSGGEVQTEIWRDWQEAVLAYTLNNCGTQNAVLCGDYNRSAEEFILEFDGANRSPNTILRFFNEQGPQTLKVYNPWFSSDGDFVSETGSYYYDKAWERIDNFFSFGNVKLSSFSAKAEEPWASEAGIPNGYKIYTGEGFSDHLPIMCTLVLGNQE